MKMRLLENICGKQRIDSEICFTTGVQQENEIAIVKSYPDPVSDHLEIMSNNAEELRKYLSIQIFFYLISETFPCL
jgi:hypothetical protein